MCGIVGFTSFKGPACDAENTLEAMMRQVSHRGPDGEGVYKSDHILLGHRRLSIIDVEGGAQPMTSRDGRYTAVFNGAVYNFLELKDELERDGKRLRTRSDTEVILEYYAATGVQSFTRFNGMFALAIWDRQAEALLLARDRIGVKPLYYAVRDGELIFASELKALLCYPAIDRRINLLSVSKYFTYGYVPTPHTIFEGINKLEPGFYLTFDRAGLQKRSYWDVPLDDDPPSARNVDEWAGDVLALLRDAVAKRLRSDVPVGVFLSGGLDSSLVATLASELSQERLHSFSIGFEESSYNESHHARRVALALGTTHHEKILTLEEAADLFPRVSTLFDEPLADASTIPTFALSQFASRHVKVALGGDGADELFAGYPSFQAHKLLRQLSFLPLPLRDLLGRLVPRLPVSHRYASLEHLLHQFLTGRGLSSEIRFLLWMGCYSNAEKAALLSTDVRDALLRSDEFDDVSEYIHRSGLKDNFQRLQYLCLKLYFQDRVLVKVDRASMAHGVEVRAPYLDADLVGQACRIQPFYKLHGFTTKYVLKKAAAGRLPRAIVNRRKTGFMMPVATWLTTHMRSTLEDLCSREALAATGLFNVSFARQLIDDHLANRRDNRKQVYALLCFMAWFNRYASANPIR